MLSFALMAVAALTIDMGFVLLARRQMQTGVDPAALDGLRFRDDIPQTWKTDIADEQQLVSECGAMPTPADSSNPNYVAWLGCARRWAAQQVVVNTFDDDLNPAHGDPMNFGAGPVVSFENSPGIPAGGQDIAAAQTIASMPSVYKPTPQLNTSDLPQGDMAKGTYSLMDGQSHQEANDYTRADFTYGPPPNGAAAPSFLVRLRRTSNFQGLDDQPSVSSMGPSLPFLFGRGSTIRKYDPALDPPPPPGYNPDYNPRVDGITVRATGIASARPVMGVGRQSTVNQIQIPGVTSFALRYKFWIQFAPTKPTNSSSLPAPGAVLTQQIELDPDPAANSLTAQSQSVGPGLDGQYLSWPSGTFPSLGWLLSTVAVSQPAFSDSINTKNYVPIYDNTFVGDGADWIVGFGVIQVVKSNPLKIQIMNGQIAPINAMGYLYGGGLDPAITGAALTSLISANQGLGAPPTSDTQPIPPVLLAPVLVRSE